ncbi:hypothetical protein D3C72_1710850 [compost metagenome]
MQVPYRRRQLLAVRAHQAQWHGGPGVILHEHDKSSRQHIVAHIQPGLVGYPFAGHGPAPGDIGVVAEQGATHLDGLRSQLPLVIDPPLLHVQQALVFEQIFGGLDGALPRQVLGRGHQHLTVPRC